MSASNGGYRIFEVGEFVYEHISFRGKRVNLQLKVTHVTTRTFKTEDGRTWAINKYNSTSFPEWGSSDSLRKEPVFLNPVEGDETWTLAQRADAIKAAEAIAAAERQAAVKELLSEGLDKAVDKAVEKYGWTMRRDLRTIRESCQQDPVKLDEYAQRLEDTIESMRYALKNMADKFDSLAFSVNNAVNESKKWNS